MHEVSSCGFPHSDIRGSPIMCISPRLFAAYHVFLRPKVPRHPPRVLVRLTTLFYGRLCIAIYTGLCLLSLSICPRQSFIELRSPFALQQLPFCAFSSMFVSGKTLIPTVSCLRLFLEASFLLMSSFSFAYVHFSVRSARSFHICGFQGASRSSRLSGLPSSHGLLSFGAGPFIYTASVLLRVPPSFRLPLYSRFWRPPALPHRLQCSTIGRMRLNRRVRYGYGCFPHTYRHQKFPSYPSITQQ